MNAVNRQPAARLAPPRKRSKWKQLGYAMLAAGRSPGLPSRVAEAHARFEHEARMAMREWLML